MIKNSRQRYITGFVVLFLLYSFYFLLARDGFFHVIHTTRKWRHVITFATILMVYAAGTWALQKHFPKWMLAAWHLLHIVFIVLLLAFGLADWTMGGLPKATRHFTQTIAETLVSPTLYVGIGLLKWGMGKMPDENKIKSNKSLSE